MGRAEQGSKENKWEKNKLGLRNDYAVIILSWGFTLNIHWRAAANSGIKHTISILLFINAFALLSAHTEQFYLLCIEHNMFYQISCLNILALLYHW